MKRNNLLLLVAFVLLFVSCNRDKQNNGGGGSEDTFNRVEMTTFWAEDFIIPALENFKMKSEQLNNDVMAFVNTPNETNLTNVRESLHEAYIANQYIGFFQIGKAEQVTMNYQYRLNTYPVNEENVNQFALVQDYNFRAISKVAPGMIAQGLPAIDYMVSGFAEGGDQAIIAKYTTDANAAKYKEYLKQVSNEILASTDEILTDWNSGYKETFIQNQSNNAAGTLSLIVNAYVQYYEKYLRAGKIGYPAGIITPMYLTQSTEIKPHLVEARYSNQHNKEYALVGLKAMQNFFNGVSFDESKNGKSLKHYIEYLDAKQNNIQLAQTINTKFDEAREKINLLQPSFVDQLNANIQPMKDAYNSLQTNVVYLKVSMPEILNVTISYMDTDGD